MSLDKYITANYDKLVAYAGIYCKDPYDLVSHTYIKVVDAGFYYVNDYMTEAYLRRAIKINATRGDFKKLYKIEHQELTNIPEEFNIDRRIAIEKIDTILRRLDYFDRTIFELYLMGENMKVLSDESKIPISTIYHTLSKVRQIIKATV